MIIRKVDFIRLLRSGLVGIIAGLLVLGTGPSAFGLEDLLIAQADTGNSQYVENQDEYPLSGALQEIFGEPEGGLIPEVPESTILPELTLTDALMLCLENNRDIQSSELNIDNAYAQRDSNLSSFLPGWSTSYSYTRYGAASTISTGDFSYTLQPIQSVRWALMFSYPLYSGGRDDALRHASDASIRAAEYDLRTELAYRTLDVIQAYLGVLEAEAGLSAMKESLTHLDEVSRTAQASYDAGLIPLNNLLSAQVARSQVAQAVTSMESNVELAKSSLAILVTGNLSDRWSLDEVEFPETDVPYPLETLWEWALENRPSLKSLDAGREALVAQIEAMKTSGNPNVSFDAQYSRTGEDLIPSTSSISGSISIFWNFYDFGGSDDRAAPLENQLEQLDLQREAQAEMIKQQVEQALLFVRTQLGNLAVSREALAQAEEAARVARRRQDEGLGLMIEVLDAEATLAQTKVNSIQILYDYYGGLAALSRTVGMPTEDLLALITAARETE
jgi:outer membrane protein